MLDRRQLVAGAAGLGLAVPFLGRGMSACRAGSARGNADTGRNATRLGSSPTPPRSTPEAEPHRHLARHRAHLRRANPHQPRPPSEPALAEGWEISEDGTSYMFVLREGVTSTVPRLKASDVSPRATGRPGDGLDQRRAGLDEEHRGN